MARVRVENVNHPGSARAVDAAKYGAMKAAWLQVLPSEPPGLTADSISERLLNYLPETLFPDGAKAGWWSKTVQLDLEAKGLVKRSGSRPMRWYRTNQRTHKTASKGDASRNPTAPGTIDEYIDQFSPEVQSILRDIRATIARAAPGAIETISYRIPAFTLNGMLIYFAAFKNHIGLYPPVKGDAALNRAIARYRGEKGNLRLPLGESIPHDLIARIVKARIVELTDGRPKPRNRV